MPDIGSTININDRESEETNDFEAAIEVCGFGLFNICLLLVAMPGLFATIFETTTMSYVLPAAECDLELSLMDKGALNAMAFAGTLISAIPWGFIADIYGRKRILVAGLLMNGILTLCSTMSQTSIQLMTFKFFGGFLTCGPVAVFLSYISEFHGKKHRMYIIIAIGMINSLPLFILPILAYMILPEDISLNLGNLEFSSWKIFIAVTALPALLSGSLFMLFPESPKFLMSQGKNKQALKAFQTIYAINKRKSKESYPIDYLYEEAPEKSLKRSLREASLTRRSFSERRTNMIIKFKDGFLQMKPLCSRTYIFVVLMVYTMYFCLLLSINAIRLWIPQYFATTKEMQYKGGYTLTTCNVLEYSINKTKLLGSTNDKNKEKCEVHIEPDSYANNIIVAGALFVTYIFTSAVLKYIGNNILLRIYMFISSISLMLFYFSISEVMTLILASIFVSAGIVSVTLILNVSVNVFPTAMRTMAVITLMSFGRLGAMLGNFILPLLMATNCIAVFVIFSGGILCSLTISFFIPNTTKEGLK